MVFDTGSVILFLIGLFFLYLLCWFFLKPIKWLLRIVLNCLLGAIGIWIFNWMFSGMQLHIAINPLTSMTAGLLGLPGMGLMLMLASWL